LPKFAGLFSFSKNYTPLSTFGGVADSAYQ
jgi:hypothetical protein